MAPPPSDPLSPPTPAEFVLALDVGNTQVKCGIFRGQQLLHVHRFASRRDVNPEAVSEQILLACQAASLEPRLVLHAVIASVVPPLNGPLKQGTAQALGLEPLLLASGSDVPIENRYEDPAAAGVDRLLNALAAFELCGGSAIVIDFGTATKIDCISPDGAFLGGAIAPGLRLSLEALAQKAAKLVEVELVRPPRSIGQNTTHALQSGLVLGHAAMVDGLVRRMSSEMGAPKQVFATGGLAPVIAQVCETITTASPGLTLRGALSVSRRSR